jgi:hypothetical protein
MRESARETSERARARESERERQRERATARESDSERDESERQQRGRERGGDAPTLTPSCPECGSPLSALRAPRSSKKFQVIPPSGKWLCLLPLPSIRAFDIHNTLPVCLLLKPPHIHIAHYLDLNQHAICNMQYIAHMACNSL